MALELDRYTIRRKVLQLFGASFHIHDAQGRVVGFSSQKAFKLREDIRIFADESRSRELLAIRARQVVDWSAAYDVVDSTEERKVGTLRRKMLRVFPALEDAGIDYAWSGRIGIGLNRMPQLGHIDEQVSYIQAYSGHGVAPTHVMARITAAMLDGDPRDFDIFARIPHWPFPGGKLLRRPGLALGMAYFKLRDAL